MGNSLREIKLRPGGAAESLAHGHPWVWRETVSRGLDGARAGEEVQVVGADGAPVGRGLVDPGSPLAVRMWTRGRAPVDAALWRERARRAGALRATLFEGGATTAYRVLHGEGDRMPGFVVDRYAAVAVARTDGDAATARVADLAEALWPTLESWGVSTLVHRLGGKGETPRLELLRGTPPPDTVRVLEHGVPFVVDLARGQKTGAFLDQRENRRRVGELARGRRVLNLFSYAGGFSLRAALGGATHVTSVDVAAGAHATAQASFRAAGVDPGAHAFATADARAFLDAARGRGERWDLVVSDPPSFAPSEKAVARALSSYRGLHRACADVLAPAGVLCAASCSSHVDAATFLTTLDDAALGRDDLRLLELRGAGADHPTLPAFPEGRYLKFAVLA
ncbi:MAG TPA: class I SAM-dependent rRNA methyltransferase [Polyangiaceae bacterium]|jgi:23S rRNA (cytosine1962-C5)-methyltransferase